VIFIVGTGCWVGGWLGVEEEGRGYKNHCKINKKRNTSIIRKITSVRTIVGLTFQPFSTVKTNRGLRPVAKRYTLSVLLLYSRRESIVSLVLLY
jgi:hypothetical protein